MFTKYLILGLSLISCGCASFDAISPLAPIERLLVFQPTAYPESVPTIPGLIVEDAWIESGENTLHGLYLPHPEPLGVALYCHGNAGNVAHRLPSMALLNQRHRLSVLAFDYQGYGNSSGSPTENGILADGRAARRWLANKAGVGEADIILMGRSLGGAVAVDLAAKDGARGLVLASTFTSIPDVAAHHVKFLPSHLLMTIRLDSLSKIPQYHGPLLYCHGDHDEVVPFHLGQRLFLAAPGRKKFITIAGGTHNSPLTEHYRLELDAFIQSLKSEN